MDHSHLLPQSHPPQEVAELVSEVEEEVAELVSEVAEGVVLDVCLQCEDRQAAGLHHFPCLSRQTLQYISLG